MATMIHCCGTHCIWSHKLKNRHFLQTFHHCLDREGSPGDLHYKGYKIAFIQHKENIVKNLLTWTEDFRQFDINLTNLNLEIVVSGSFMIKLTTVHALCIDNQESGSKSHRSSAISYVNNHWVISFIKLVALKDRVFFIPYV